MANVSGTSASAVLEIVPGRKVDQRTHTIVFGIEQVEPGVGQNIALHVSPAARDSAFSISFNFIVSQILFKHEVMCMMDSESIFFKYIFYS